MEWSIESVDFIPLRTPLEKPAVFSWGSANSRNVGLVRVLLSDGVEGYGETSVTFPLWSLEERVNTVRALGLFFVGKTFSSLTDIDELLAEAEKSFQPLKFLWSPVAISAGLGAIEMAVLDAWSRSRGEALWQLLGGADRPQPMYAVGMSGTPEEVAKQCVSLIDSGFTAVKLRVGFGAERDVSLVSTVRDALGEDAKILLDANMGWDREQAKLMIRRLLPFNPAWIEEPLPHDDLEGLVTLSREFSVPLAAGENAYGSAALERLFSTGALSWIMPDLARCGGFLNGLRIAKKAADEGVGVSPHHYASDIGFAADVALTALLPEGGLLLRDVSHWPIRSEIVDDRLRFERGKALPHRGPGLSPEPNASVMRETALEES
jgi:D-galactarolactone cycloisomerase